MTKNVLVSGGLESISEFYDIIGYFDMFQGYKKVTPFGGTRNLRLTQPSVRRVIGCENFRSPLYFNSQWSMNQYQTDLSPQGIYLSIPTMLIFQQFFPCSTLFSPSFLPTQAKGGHSVKKLSQKSWWCQLQPWSYQGFLRISSNFCRHVLIVTSYKFD